MKKKISLIICFTLLINLFTVSAAYAKPDSGLSALPQETPMQKYCYKYIAPKTQTTYKVIYSKETPVEKLAVEGKKVMAFAESINDLGGKYGVLGALVKKLPYSAQIGAITYISGKTLYCIANKNYKELSSVKKGSKLKTTVSFKWKNPEKLTYSVKISEYFTFNGKKVGQDKDFYFDGQVN